MMKDLRAFFASIIVVFSSAMLCVSLAACGAATQPSAPIANKASKTQTPQLEADWHLERLADKAGNLEGLPPNSAISLDLEQGKVSGSGGCNRYFGNYRLQGEQIRIESIGSTMMACDERIMELEQHFFERLTQTVSFRIEAGQLLFLDAHNKPLLVFSKTEKQP